MKMIRLIMNLAFFAAGAGLGIYWGVNHPTQATDIAQREERAALDAKIDFLTKFGNNIPNGAQMLSDDQKKLSDLDAATQASSN
jgi:hypothetical protein